MICFCLSCYSLFAGDPDDVAAFKEYLSHPVCISRLLYTVQQHSKDDGGDKIVLAYCGDGFYIRQIAEFDNIDQPISLSNRTHGAFFAGKSGDLSWQISGFGVGKSINANNLKPDGYAAFSDSMKVVAGGIVNLGSQQILPGTFVWNGDEFEATPSPHVHRVPPIEKFVGKIFTKNGRVIQMDMAKSLTSFHYEYAPSSNRPSWFPSKVTMLVDGKCFQICTIHEVSFDSIENLAGQFLPERHIERTVEILTVISNSQIIIKPIGDDPDVVTLIRQQFPEHTQTVHSVAGKISANIVIVTVLFSPLAFILWRFILGKRRNK